MKKTSYLFQTILRDYSFRRGRRLSKRSKQRLISQTKVNHAVARMDRILVVDQTERNTWGIDSEIIVMHVPNLVADQPFEVKISTRDNFTFDTSCGLPDRSCDFSYDIVAHHIEGLAVFPNVIFVPDTLMLRGTISEPGEYHLQLYGFARLVAQNGDHLERSWPNDEYDKPVGDKSPRSYTPKKPIVGQVKMTVIPNPRTLWKNVASDSRARYHKPDHYTDSRDQGAVRFVGASVRGRSHAHRGSHRDDDFRFGSAESPWHIIAVADGAGSCQYARRGAELAVETAVTTLEGALKSEQGAEIERVFLAYQTEQCVQSKQTLQEACHQTIVQAAYHALVAIEQTVDQTQGETVKDYSTTLLIVAHKRLNAEEHLVLSLSVGDGVIAAYDPDQAVTLLSKPDSGPFAGQTRFLTRDLFENHSINQRVMLQRIRSMKALIVATDGVTDPWFETEKQLSELVAWEALWQAVAPLVTQGDCQTAEKALLEWLSFWSPGHHDDRTIALLLFGTNSYKLIIG